MAAGSDSSSDSSKDSLYDDAVKLVKRAGKVKHMAHGDNRGDVPIPDRLIERGITKHIVHVRNRRDVPVADGLVKGRSFLEHLCHEGN